MRSRRALLCCFTANLGFAQITIVRSARTKRKTATHIQGLSAFGVDLKKAAKLFAGKFATGASVSKGVTGEEEIVVQGDVGDEVVSSLSSVPCSASARLLLGAGVDNEARHSGVTRGWGKH